MAQIKNGERGSPCLTRFTYIGTSRAPFNDGHIASEHLNFQVLSVIHFIWYIVMLSSKKKGVKSETANSYINKLSVTITCLI
jgi:hypothetical protein